MSIIDIPATPAARLPSRLRVALVLWLAAMAGVALLSVSVVPQMLARLPPAVPPAFAIAASMLQSGVLLALACWGGAVLSRSVGLRAPVVEAMLSAGAAGPILRAQWLPAALGGLLVGAWLVALAAVAPEALRDAGHDYRIPLLAKVLYGGVTEEVLMRWGLMTALAWLFARVSRRHAAPAHFVLASLVSAIAFGAGHLPAVLAMGIALDIDVLAYVVFGNALPGIVFGLLYWRRGLGCAVLAHAGAHVVATAWSHLPMGA